MPADTLLDIVTRACSRLSKRITDIGEIPYDLIRPVLLKIESPEQLHQLETNSPQIIGHDAEIWLALIKRDIPDWQNKRHEPRDPQNWWKVYRKLKEESQNAMAQGEDKLKAALDNIQSEKEQNLAQFVPKKELPRAGPSMRHRIVHGYASGRTGSAGASRLSLMEKVKKEARDARAARMAVPNRDPLKKSSTLVARPPQQFMEDIRREKSQMMQRQHPSPERPLRAPRPPMHAPRTEEMENLSYEKMAYREARLKALTSGKAIPRPDPTPAIAIESPSIPAGRRRSSVSMAVSSEPFGHVTTNSETAESALSASFLESPGSSPRRLLDSALERPRTRSPGRIASPQPGKFKRKEPPSLFMSSPKKVMKRPGLA